MSSELEMLWADLQMCEYYLNNKIRTNIQYYTRMRHWTLKQILKLQLAEFNHE